MNALLRRVKNVANDRLTRVLFYDQTLKKGYASLAPFSKLLILRRTLVTAVAFPLSLVCWVFLVVLNLFIPVKIYRFDRPHRPDKASLFISQMEPLCRGLQIETQKKLKIMIDANAIVNLELLKLYASHFNLYLDDRSKFARTIFSLIPKLGFTKTFVPYSRYDTNWELAPARNLKISKPTEIPGELSAVGIKPFNYVIIAFPAITYYLKRIPEIVSSSNRFIDPSTSADALKLLIYQGLKIVRVGQDTDDIPLNLKELPIIDLSGTFRSDAQDLWLFEHCLFNWSMGAVGTWHFAHKFDRPTLVTDSYALHKGYQSTLFTVRKIHSSFENRNLTFKELLNSKGFLGRTQEMNSQQLTYIQNTPRQLCDAVEEILLFANGIELGSAQNIELLEKYDRMIVNSGFPIRKNSHSSPCATMLRDYVEFLK